MNNLIASVSVVIPCYRCCKTITRALQSVVNQTLRPGEVILVEDGSGDDTLQLLYRLRDEYPTGWVKVIALEKNMGPAAARNAGWAIAQYSYIAFLDADDSWHPKKIEIQYSWMLQHPHVAMTGHALEVQKNSESTQPLTERPLDSDPILVSKKSLLISNRFSTPTVMLRRDLPQRFDDRKHYSEDYLLWLEISCSGLIQARFPAVLAWIHKARFGEGGLSSHMWAMLRGELDTYHQLSKKNKIKRGTAFFLSIWSLIKYLRRCYIAFFTLR